MLSSILIYKKKKKKVLVILEELSFYHIGVNPQLVYCNCYIKRIDVLNRGIRFKEELTLQKFLELTIFSSVRIEIPLLLTYFHVLISPTRVWCKKIRKSYKSSELTFDN